MPEFQIARQLFLISAFLSFIALAGLQGEDNNTSVSETSGPDFRSQVEKQTFILINQYRKESDLSPLTWDDAIAKTARAHSKDMATGEVDFGHDGFSDRVDHLKQALHGVWGAGENVLYTSNLVDVARNAVQMWLHSPHHLKNIRGDYNFSGLGVWQDKNGVIYFTQIFVKIVAHTQETESEPEPGNVAPFGMLASPETRPER
jgi:uncharacterized protein YkwD